MHIVVLNAVWRWWARNVLFALMVLACGASPAAADPNIYFGITSTSMSSPTGPFPSFSCGNLTSTPQTNVVCTLTGLPSSVTGTQCSQGNVQPGAYFSCQLDGSLPAGLYAFTIIGSADSVVPETTGGTIYVNGNATTSAVATPAAPAFYQTVTVTVTVTGTAGIPTGQVTINRKDLSTGNVVQQLQLTLDSAGQASYTFNSGGTSTAFEHLISYLGDGTSEPSSTTLITSVPQQPTVPAITMTPANPAPGEPFTYTVSLSGEGSQKPTGLVKLGYGPRIRNVLAEGPLDANGSFPGTTALPEGTYDLILRYFGDGNYYAWSWRVATLTIAAGSTPSTTALTASPSSAYTGQPVTLTATVSPAAVTGSVSFSDGGTVLCAGAAVTNGVATCTTTFTTGGTHALNATYFGNIIYAASNGTLAMPVQSMQPQSITFPKPADIVYAPGATVSLTASASSGLAVTYASLTTSVCTVSGATATFVAAGTCTIKASQAGNANYAAAADVTVSFGALSPPQIAATATVSPSMFSRPGVTLTFTFTLANSGGLGATGLSLRDVRLGVISCASPTIAPSGGTVTCSGSTVTTVADLSARRVSVSPQATYSFSLPGAAVSAAPAAAPAATTVTVSLSVAAVATVDVAAIQTATQSAIQSLMSQRANVLTTSGPDTSRANARLAGGTLFGGADDGSSPPAASYARPSMLGGQDRFGGMPSLSSFGQGMGDVQGAMLGSGGMSGAPSSFDRDTPGSGNSLWQAFGMWRDYTDAQTSRPTAPSGFRFSGTAEDGAGRFAFATSLSQWRAAAAAEDQAKRASLGLIATSPNGAPIADSLSAGNGPSGAYVPGTTLSSALARDAPRPGSIDVWAEATASYVTGSRHDDRRKGHAFVAHTGIDMIVMPGLLVGVMGTYDSIATEAASIGQSQKGNGWMAGPYLSARLTQNVYFDARTSWGRASNQVDPLGGWVDDFSTTRSLASAKLTGSWKLGDWKFRPSAEVIWFSETAKDYVNAIGITIPGQTFSLGRTLFGPEIGYHMVLPDKAVLEPFFGIKGVWDFARTEETTAAGEPIDAKGIHARIEAGASLRTPSGITLRATGSYDGLGAAEGYRAVQGQARVTVPLQ